MDNNKYDVQNMDVIPENMDNAVESKDSPPSCENCAWGYCDTYNYDACMSNGMFNYVRKRK